MRGSAENENCKSGILSFFSYGLLNIENSQLSHIFMSALFRERLMHRPLVSFLTVLWHLLDVSAVAGHGTVLAALFIDKGDNFCKPACLPIHWPSSENGSTLKGKK